MSTDQGTQSAAASLPAISLSCLSAAQVDVILRWLGLLLGLVLIQLLHDAFGERTEAIPYVFSCLGGSFHEEHLLGCSEGLCLLGGHFLLTAHIAFVS